MLVEKAALTIEDLESQTALELPDRELMQIQSGLINVTDVLTGNSICALCNVTVAANVCGVSVNVLATNLGQGGGQTSCTTPTGQQLLVQRANHTR